MPDYVVKYEIDIFDAANAEEAAAAAYALMTDPESLPPCLQVTPTGAVVYCENLTDAQLAVGRKLMNLEPRDAAQDS